MSSSYYGNAHYNPQNPIPSTAQAAHAAHHGRARRAPRLPPSQNSQRQFRGVRSMKDVAGPPHEVTFFRKEFEAGRSFDLDDDLEFCPTLLTEHDRISIYFPASSSDGSSPNTSPESSPAQHTKEVVPTRFSLNSNTPPYIPGSAFHSSPAPHQPIAPIVPRVRNAIPIVNPSTGIRMTSPPQTVPPARMQQQQIARRW